MGQGRVAEHADDWPLPGRDHANSRAVTDSPIDASSVGGLEVVWTAPLPGSGAYGSASTTPLVLGDLVLIQDLRSNVRAFELATGEPVWETVVDEFQIGPNGVAVGWGRVFATKGMEQVMALDVTSGAELDEAIDAVRDKYGSSSLRRAVQLGKKERDPMPMLPD